MSNSPLPAMTPQQRRFTASSSKLRTYKEFMVGEAGWMNFVAFELYNLVFSSLSGMVGIGVRGVLLPFFLRSADGKPTVGRGVTIRQPGRIRLGRGVILDDYSVLDIRSNGEAGEISLGEHTFVGRYSMIVAKAGSIIVGRACNISSSCRIATQSRVEIGESVLISAYVYIGPGNHRIDSVDTPIMEQEMELAGGVVIGDNSWIGAGVTIVDGVKIGRNVVIGAHSLVRSDIPDNAVAAGTPAKVIRMR